jgi:hypothetical protein
LKFRIDELPNLRIFVLKFVNSQSRQFVRFFRHRPINPGMDQFIVLAIIAASLLTPLAAARGMLGLLLHLMTVGRQAHLAASRPHTPASL